MTPPVPPEPARPLESERPPATPAKRPMLAWWGVVPFLVFVVIEAVWGWPAAKANALGGRDYAVSYFIGGLLGGLLIALAAGWLAYRLCRRSKTAGTVGFTVLLILVSLSVITKRADHLPRRPTAVAATENQAGPSRFPLFGLAVDNPSGWRALPPDRSGIITRWVGPAAAAGGQRGLIVLEIKKPDADARRIAESLAKNWGGRVVETQETLDGEVAWRVLADNTTTQLRPVEAIVCIHDTRLYLLTGGVAAGQSCQDQIRSIRQSWKWIPLETVAGHLAFRAEPVVLFDGQVSINFPAALMESAKNDRNARFNVSFPNFEIGANDFNDFSAYVQSMVMNEGDTLADVKTRIAEGVREKYNLPEAFVWSDVPTTAIAAAITQPVPGPAAGVKTWITWGIAELPGRRVVLVNFDTSSTRPDDRAAYAETARKIMQSIVPAASSSVN